MLVESFTRDDMVLFVKFASFVVLGHDDSGLMQHVELSKSAVLRLMPLVDYYSCELLWNYLINWIQQHPDLDVVAAAEKFPATDQIQWNTEVIVPQKEDAFPC